jgi:hypothetical protein
MTPPCLFVELDLFCTIFVDNTFLLCVNEQTTFTRYLLIDSGYLELLDVCLNCFNYLYG